MASPHRDVLFVPYSAAPYQLYPQTSFPPGDGVAASHTGAFMLPHPLRTREIGEVYPGIPSRSAEIHPGQLESQAHP